MATFNEIRDKYDEMVAMRNAGGTIPDIAKHFNISQKRLKEIFRDGGVYRDIGISQKDIERLGGIKEISQKLGIKQNKLKKILAEAGLHNKKKGK